MNSDVFREYDIRGVVDRDLDADFAHLLGRAIGTYAARHGVQKMTLGRDCRLSSKSYQEAIGRGIMTTGVGVIDIGLCATPMLYFSIRHVGVDGGVMVTGSHNPPDFNGFKICIGPDTIYGEEIQELRRIIEGGSFTTGSGTYAKNDVSAAYQQKIFDTVRVKPGLRIVLDGGNGVGGFFALPLLKRYGCKVSDIYCDPDGRFPHHFPDPTVPENLEELIRVVRETKADAGIAYDGDADRIGVITDRGDVLWGDELLILFARYVLKKNPGAAVIGEVKCSQKLYDDIARCGGRAIMWKAGHSLIKGKMKEEKALLAGEMSGHIFFADRYFGYDDAIYASARLFEILSESGQRLSELLADLPRTFTTPEIRVACDDRTKFRVVDSVRDHFLRTHGNAVITIDGVRIPFGDGWALLRASNTQPVLVLRFEAADEKRLAAIRSSIEAVMNTTMRSFE